MLRRLAWAEPAAGRQTQTYPGADRPTVLELLGLPPLTRAQGGSLTPLLRDAAEPGREFACAEFNRYIHGGVHTRAAPCRADRMDGPHR